MAKSREEVKARMRALGLSIAEVAREVGVHPALARRVLAGTIRGERGDAHRFAVAVGLKDGTMPPSGRAVLAAIRSDAADTMSAA